MKYLKPKAAKKKVTWNISEKTLTILSYYSKYSQYKKDEIVDRFMENLLTDDGFIDWINKQRNRKKIEAILQECELVTTLKGGEQNGETKETNEQE